MGGKWLEEQIIGITKQTPRYTELPQITKNTDNSTSQIAILINLQRYNLHEIKYRKNKVPLSL